MQQKQCGNNWRGFYSLTPSGWMSSTAEDKTEIDYEKLLKEYHAFLKPIWDQFRDALFDYKYGIIPDREQLHRSRKNIDRDKASAIFRIQIPVERGHSLRLGKDLRHNADRIF